MTSDAELDALDRRIAEEWCGWTLREDGVWIGSDGRPTEYRIDDDPDDPFHVEWRPTRNPADAGEARRMALQSNVRHFLGRVTVYVAPAWHDWEDSRYAADVSYQSTNSDKAAAEALATSRAIEAALNARKSHAD